jgi:hypothetical protein
MRVDYTAQPAGRSPVTFTVDTDRGASTASGRGARASRALPVWTELSTHKCDGCPLGADETHCPAAADLVPVVDALRDLRSIERTEVTVTVAGREIRRHTDLQELVRSVVGVLLASSACPTLRTMKPLADLHQPFATFEETLFRAVALHLVRAWFDRKDGKDADFDLDGLRAHYESMGRINQGLAKRIRSLGSGDAGVNGLIQLFSMSMCMSDELDTQLGALRTLVAREATSAVQGGA